MLTDIERDLLRRSWRLVIPIADTAADLFYKRLFELRPDYRHLFGEDMASQKRKLLRMLAFVVRAVDWREDDWREDVSPDEDLLLVVLALGRRHAKLYEIPDESYAVVGEALLWTLGYGLGDAFNEDVKRAWTELYTSLARTMRMGGVAAVEGDAWRATGTVEHQGEAALLEQEARVGIDAGRYSGDA